MIIYAVSFEIGPPDPAGCRQWVEFHFLCRPTHEQIASTVNEYLLKILAPREIMEQLDDQLLNLHDEKEPYYKVEVIDNRP